MRMRTFFLVVSSIATILGCSESHGVDSGTPPSDGFTTDECLGAAPSCYEQSAGWPGCCTVPSGEPSFCVLGSWECPRGQLAEPRCSTIDPTGVCESIDAGPPSDWGTCGVTSECTLAANSCCGVCGLATASDMDGVNTSQIDAHYAAVCPVPEPCPGCPSALNPELVATCEAGRCAVLDIGTEDLSACTTDGECIVRVPDCCPCGADTSSHRLVAMRADRVGDYVARVCDPDSACPECEPIYPADVTAVCGTDGHCEIAFVGP